MKKRNFLKLLAGAGLLGPASGFTTFEKALRDAGNYTPEELAQNEDFWQGIRSDYHLKPDYINLENGYYNLIPRYTLDRFLEHVKDVNYQGSYYMRTMLWGNKIAVHERLAELTGCLPGEIALTRNTTESLDIVIGGFHWKAGDEAVMAVQDYGTMLDMFKLQAQRHGIVNKMVSVPNHPASDEEIVDLYAGAITPNTKLLMVCHMINITGHILPVKKICDMAHSKGVEVMVDGAHTIGHLDFKIPDLGCDYFGSSLHKWLSTPLGVGLLYVNKEKIPTLWPTFANLGYQPGEIRRISHIGTHPVHTDLAVNDAIDYYHMIGPDRKQARMRYLREYWMNQVKDVKNIVINTPNDPQRACGIGNVGIATMKPADLAKTLLDKYRIWTVAIDGAGVQGCRISPNVYTTTKELDKFAAALKELSQSTK